MASDHEVQFATAGRDGGSTAPANGNGAAADAVDEADSFERERATVVLLRQLSSGLSAYRLFPGDLNQPTFVQAVERIRDAAQAALEWGPFEAEIMGSRFMTPTGPVPADERIERLALAMYQHRAERFWLHAPPDGRDLGALYEALCTDVKGAAPGGVGAALRVAGVKSLAVREVAPQPLEEDSTDGLTTEEQRALWDRLSRPDQFARELVSSLVSIHSAQEAAREALARLERLLSVLPERLVKGFELYARLHDVIVRLPKTLRRAVMTALLDKVEDDPLAEGLIGTMTDAELARVLVDQGVGGRAEPVDLAKGLVRAGIRREALVELTLALRMGRVEGGTIIAGLERVGIEAPAPGAVSSVARTVSNLLARGLVGVGQEDIRGIREDYPQAGQQQQLALDALSDYLRAETDAEQLGEVLRVWADEASAALRRRDREQLVHLLHVIESVGEDEVDLGKSTLVEATLRGLVSPEILADLVSPADGEGTAESTVPLLAPFGEMAVDWLMEDLAQEKDRGRRALLLAILAEVARGHHHRVAERLADPRWFVARNAVTVLYRTGDPEVIPMLVEASRHREAPVRREAVRGLLAVAGLDALTELLVLAIDQDASVRSAVIAGMGGLIGPEACDALARLTYAVRDPADRRQAIDALARHPAAEAAEVLGELASSRARPRLPRRIRRHAKALLKKRREGAL